MKLLKKRGIAWAVLIVSVLISVFAFGGSGLRSARSGAVNVFMNGVDPSDTAGGVKLSCDQYLKESAEYATLMAEECRRYVSLENATASEVLSLSKSIKDGKDLNPRIVAYRDLAGKIESLYTEFHASQLAEDQAAVFDDNYSDFTQDAASQIRHDGYNDIARKYNESHSGALERLVGGILGIGALELF